MIAGSIIDYPHKEKKMGYFVVFVVGFLLGMGFAVLGSMEVMKSGRMFYRRDNGTWFPYDPQVHRK